MSRRILGQCGRSDFASIEHLAVALKEPEMFDTSTLTSRQKFAFHFIALTAKKGIPWRLLRAVDEVLFWGDGQDVSAVEIKFVRDQSKVSEVGEFKTLWYGR